MLTPRARARLLFSLWRISPLQDTPPDRIPKVKTPDGKGTIAVVAGEALGTKAVIDTRSPMYGRALAGLWFARICVAA